MVLALSVGVGLAAGAPAQVPPALSEKPHPAAAPAPHAAALATVHPLATAAKPRPAPPAAAKPAQPAAPVAVQANGARLAPGTAMPPAELEAFVDGAVRQAMSAHHIAGVAVAVVQNGQVVLDKGYGFAGTGRAVDPNTTLFRVGSISKTFTWIALMKQVEAGRMRLDSPVNLYLPEPLQVRDQGFKRPVFVRDLLTHSAGFEDRSLGQLFEKDPDRVRPLADYLRQERPSRVREAGVVSVYSNYGAMLAGAAASYVDGRPYQDLIDSEILNPLGLRHTSVREPYPARADLPRPMPSALAADLSTGYRWAGGGYQPQAFEYITQGAPAGAVSSTAGDMARYMMMILNGGALDGATIYGPDVARGFRTPLQANAPGVNGWDDGFMEFSLPGGFRGQGHGGDTLWFHSMMVTVPDLNLGVFVTTNTNTGVGLVTLLPQEIVGRFYAPPPAFPRAGVPSLFDDRAVYAGTYLDDRRPYHGLGKFVFTLIGQAQIAVTRDGRLLTPSAGGEQAWIPDGAAGQFQRVDGPGRTAFEIKNGKAVRWYPASGVTALDRVGPLYQAPVLGLMAALALLASLATLIGLAVRDTRESRQTPTQARASLVQTTISLLWLVAMACFAAWAAGAGDVGRIMYGWPGPLVLIASACALVAALLTLLVLVMTPVVWRGGRRLDSWTIGRKLRFTLTTLIFAAFSLQLLLWGALAPWSG
ncbi:MAG TPA: serine hydrolase domain-containing protein [Caulobacteraceae bacterium]|jgi:CubicO group peptidase (beta-lactamase class C family)|nr:serine hydrolase domain-containing protein [Caulobacteraceae bacterium]